MLRVCPFKEGKASEVPAVVHVDGTGRLQTLTPEANGPFYDLVNRFFEKTGVPMVLNTSFNIMGEPIVETPEDALFCLLATGLDYCVLEDRIVAKKATMKFNAAHALMDALDGIRARLHRDAEYGESERAANRAMIDVHNVCTMAITRFREEIVSHLGCTTPDLKPENAPMVARELIGDLAWEKLEKESAEHLITALMVNAMLMRSFSCAKDWSVVALEIIKAAEIELSRKLLSPIVRWARKQGDLPQRSVVVPVPVGHARRLDRAVPGTLNLGAVNASADSMNEILSLTKMYDVVQSPVPGAITALGVTGPPTTLVSKFAARFKYEPLRIWFADLPTHLQDLIARRDLALKHPMRNRFELNEVLRSLVPLLNGLAIEQS
jgi:hypothetical protein